MSNLLRSHGLQHAKLSCPSPSPGVCSYSRPLRQWCHLTISSSVAPFSSYLLLLLCSIRVFSNESTLCMRWPKYWSFSFTICLSNEYSGLISFRIDWFDLLAIQGILRSLLQYCNLKALILWCSAFLMVQLSHLYMTTGKTIALTIQTLVVKVISLLFNMLPRFVIAFLPKSKHLLPLWMQSESWYMPNPFPMRGPLLVLVSPPEMLLHQVWVWLTNPSSFSLFRLCSLWKIPRVPSTLIHDTYHKYNFILICAIILVFSFFFATLGSMRTAAIFHLI